MNKILLVGAALGVLVASQANATDLQYYAGLKTGVNKLDVKYEGVSKEYHDFSLMPSFGVRLNKYLRGEFEYGVRGVSDEDKTRDMGVSEKEETEILMYTGSLQLYAEFPNSTFLTPFVNAGIGATLTDVEYKYRNSLGESEKDKGDETSFTWNVGAGVSARVNDRISIDATYRYTDFNEVEDIEFTTNEFLLGIRYDF
ncbi:MAG: porin family protein [Alphaproteobacteria bacterium]|nr:porin family protein [Alphaproteobacteria bacterium]